MEAWQLIGSAEQAPTQSFVDYYHRAWVSPVQDLECRLRLAVQERFVVTMSGAGYGQALQQLLHGQRPKPKPVFFLRINPDRCFDADYTRVDCRKQEEVHIEKFAEFRAKYAAFSEQDWRAVIQQTRTLAARIEQRGGKIIFVRFPTSGKIRACDEENFPRLRFWNQLTADLHAIHFEDVPTLRTFTCPDGSHLDERDKPAFTRALATELARRQWIQTGKGVVAQSRPVPSAGTGSPD